MKEKHHMKKKVELLGVTTRRDRMEEKQCTLMLKGREIQYNTGSEQRQSEI